MTHSKCNGKATLKKVLIIDSKVPILKKLKNVFDQETVEVLTASDGNLGLAMALTWQPDLIVMDLMLPSRSGFMLLEHLWSHSDWACPTIVVTKNEGRRHREYAKVLGVEHYLLKPVNLSLFKRLSLELLAEAESPDQVSHLQGPVHYTDCTKLAAFSPLS